MNWTRIALAGVAAGIVTWISDFVLHGMVMAPTYQRLSQVYTQTAGQPGALPGGLARDLLHGRAPVRPDPRELGGGVEGRPHLRASSSVSCSSSSASTTPW